MRNLFAACWPFDILFTDKVSIIRIAEKRVRVRRIRRTGEESATAIRNAIAADAPWQQLTGRSVAALITACGGERRIKRAYGKTA